MLKMLSLPQIKDIYNKGKLNTRVIGQRSQFLWFLTVIQSIC